MMNPCDISKNLRVARVYYFFCYLSLFFSIGHFALLIDTEENDEPVRHFKGFESSTGLSFFPLFVLVFCLFFYVVVFTTSRKCDSLSRGIGERTRGHYKYIILYYRSPAGLTLTHSPAGLVHEFFKAWQVFSFCHL